MHKGDPMSQLMLFPKSLSVVFLCFNDQDTIENCIRESFEVFDTITSSLEVIVVEDGSSDRSATVLERARLTWPSIKIIWHEANQGYGFSLQDGLEEATGDLVLCSDGDGQFKVSDGLLLLRSMEPGIDIVSGQRSRRADAPYRKWSGRIFNIVARAWLAPELPDIDCGFKLFRASSIEKLLPIRSKMAVWVEIMAAAHRNRYQIRSVPVEHRPRVSGKSAAFTLSNIFVLLKELGILLKERPSSANSIPVKPIPMGTAISKKYD
jgi:glycosyltransferase involved in cell wall biosynthesis